MRRVSAKESILHRVLDSEQVKKASLQRRDLHTVWEPQRVPARMLGDSAWGGVSETDWDKDGICHTDV